jgi:putative transcriptional regulator
VKTLNPARQKNVKSPKRLLSHSLLIILILSALLLVSASWVAATLVRENHGHRMGAAALPNPDNRKTEKELAQGRFLVADRRLMDPNFRETVVLLIRYGPEGTVGLVINRPLQIKLSVVFPDVKGLDESKETLYLGGPVEPDGMLLLVRSATPPEDSMPVFGDVYLSSSQKVLQRLIKTPDPGDRFRIYAGYAGWAPKQLEYECDRKDWHVLEADAETLFDRNPSEIWPELIQRVSANWVRLTHPGILFSDNLSSGSTGTKKVSRQDAKTPRLP